MNFDEAMNAHLEWKEKLKKYLSNPDKSISSSTLSHDDICPLGQWIHSEEGKNLMQYNEMKDLLEEHMKFHKEAGNIVERCTRGEDVTKEITPGSESEYLKLTSKVVLLLTKLKFLLK